MNKADVRHGEHKDSLAISNAINECPKLTFGVRDLAGM
jgi:hypothetical protein